VTVTVAASNGKALSGQAVTFGIASGGGSVNPGSAQTDANGQATTRWAFGNTLGGQSLTVTSGAISQTIAATVTAGAPRTVTVTAGASQSATVNGTVATPPAVTVRDVAGNPVAGVQVSFASTPGGAPNPTTVTTDASGVARLTSWQLGAQAGTYTLTGNVLAQGVTGNPVTITATATAGAATRIDAVAGANGSAAVGSLLAGSLVPAVQVRDAAGNPVAGVAVTFTAPTGGGTITGGTQTTNAQGIATVGSFTVGTVAGPNTIQATAAGIGSVTLVITGIAGSPASAAVTTGDNQAVRAGQSLPAAPSIRVVDRFGNPVSGAAVTFVVTSGGGSVSGATQTTNAQGIATVGGFQLGATPGTNTIEARVNGVTPVVITAAGLAGAPATIALANAADTIVNVTAFQRSTAVSVIVRDADGFPVRNATVTFAVTPSTLGTLSNPTATTDAAGRATTTVQTAGVLGTGVVTGTVGSLAPVTVALNVLQNVPAIVREIQGNGQTATAGTVVAVVPMVEVRDAAGNPVPGVPVFFSIVSTNLGGGLFIPVGGDQTPQGVVDTTDALGRADAGGWQLGGTPGQNVLSAIVSAPNVTNNPIRFLAQGIATPAGLTIAVAGGNGQTAAAGSFVATAPSVVVKNGAGAPVAGVTVQFLPSNDGVATPQFAQTNANGIATATWKLQTTAGPNTLTAAIVGAGVSVQLTATGQ
jgi:adhesin/invasin